MTEQRSALQTDRTLRFRATDLDALDDSQEFVQIVDRVIDRLLQTERPPRLILVKLDNWFGSRWLNFSGKMLGELGVWRGTPTVPPFVPHRIKSERHFEFPEYAEVAFVKSIHRNMTSNLAMTRTVSDIANGAAIVWYSGNSRKNGRGSIMAYVPSQGTYHPWYSEWSNEASWVLKEAINIDRSSLLQSAQLPTQR